MCIFFTQNNFHGMPGKHIKEMHETSILDKAHIFREVLMCKNQIFIMVNKITYRYHIL